MANMPAQAQLASPPQDLQSTNRRTPMFTGAVPDEVLLMIINKIDYKSLPFFMRTCRKFYNITSPELYKRDASGPCSMLHWSCMQGLTHIVESILDAGAPLNKMFTEKVRRHNTEVAYRRNQERHIQGEKSRQRSIADLARTPLEVAVIFFQVDIVRLLVSRGANGLDYQNPHAPRRGRLANRQQRCALERATCLDDLVDTHEFRNGTEKSDEMLYIMLNDQPQADQDASGTNDRLFVRMATEVLLDDKFSPQALGIILDSEIGTFRMWPHMTQGAACKTPLGFLLSAFSTQTRQLQLLPHHWQKIELLLQRGHATFFPRYEYPIINYCLHFTPSEQLVKLVRLLLSYGAHPNIVDYGNESPLATICAWWHKDAPTNDKGFSVQRGHALDLMKLLLEAGADPDGDGCMVRTLHEDFIMHPEPINVEIKPFRERLMGSPLRLICESPSPRHGSSNVELFKLLLEKGARTHITNMAGDTILHDAVYHFRVDIVHCLLTWQPPVNINASNEDGKTPLHVALFLGETKFLHSTSAAQLSIIKMLILHGADTRARNNGGERPVEIAREGKNTTLAGLLEKVDKARDHFEEMLNREGKAWDEDGWRDRLKTIEF
ncbi:ankyrin repeat-containing domain protein [Xylariaceae sp. FL0662B]|nr:ankyrin repeat-containing domain protein [Xylariaceae sp. FL0662B]